MQEREQPELLAKTPSRRRRIARGSGKTEVDVSGLLTAYAGMRSRMGQLSKMMKMSGGGRIWLGAHVELCAVCYAVHPCLSATLVAYCSA